MLSNTQNGSVLNGVQNVLKMYKTKCVKNLLVYQKTICAVNLPFNHDEKATSISVKFCSAVVQHKLVAVKYKITK